MTPDFRCPDVGVIDRARRGIAAVRTALARTGRHGWVVYALRAVEIYEDEWALYLITQRSSVPLSHDMAAALALERLWVSGRVPARILPADLVTDAPGPAPVSVIEVIATVFPVRDHGSHRSRDGASLVAAVVDAREAEGVRLTIALPHPPIGWPR